MLLWFVFVTLQQKFCFYLGNLTVDLSMVLICSFSWWVCFLLPTSYPSSARNAILKTTPMLLWCKYLLVRTLGDNGCTMYAEKMNPITISEICFFCMSKKSLLVYFLSFIMLRFTCAHKPQVWIYCSSFWCLQLKRAQWSKIKAIFNLNSQSNLETLYSLLDL